MKKVDFWGGGYQIYTQIARRPNEEIPAFTLVRYFYQAYQHPCL